MKPRLRAMVVGALVLAMAGSANAAIAKGGPTDVIDVKGSITLPPPGALFVDACALPNLDALMLVQGDIKYALRLTLGRGNRLADLRLQFNFGDLDARPVLAGIIGTAHYTVNGTLVTNQKIDLSSGSGKLEPVNGHFFILRAGRGNDLKLSVQIRGNVHRNGDLSDVVFDFGSPLRQVPLLGLMLNVHHAECGEFKLV
jgi:hypothetical protein